MPKVSIGIAVYNGEKFISRALQSVLDQRFQDFEVIVVNDGSTDGTARILGEFSDPRIKILDNTTNQGVIITRNKYLDAAQGEYIAVLDADDEWLPEKLDLQVEFMDENRDVVACGCYAERVKENRREVDVWKYPLDSSSIAVRLLWGSALVHSSTVFRRNTLKTFDIRYALRSDLNGVEDFRIFTELIKCGRLVNLPEILLRYYEHSEQITFSQIHQQKTKAVKVAVEYLESTIDLKLTPSQASAFSQLLTFSYSEIDLSDVRSVVEIIHAANLRAAFFHEATLMESLSSKWFQACFHHRSAPFRTWRTFNAINPLLKRNISAKQRVKLLIKSALGK